MSRLDGRTHYDECWRSHFDCAATIIGQQAQEIESLKAEIDELRETMTRAYMRLQNADVPRDPWHHEVSGLLR